MEHPWEMCYHHLISHNTNNTFIIVHTAAGALGTLQFIVYVTVSCWTQLNLMMVID